MGINAKGKINLPDYDSLEKLNIPVLDKLTELIYYPLSGILYQERFRMVLSYLEGKTERILEAGCGRGLFLFELSKRCSELYGLDIHPRLDVIDAMLRKNGLNNVYLNTGSIVKMPYKDKMFDAIVCVSVLEHLKDLRECFLEFSRVLKDSGKLIIGFPVKNKLTDLLFRLIKYDAAKIHPSSHREIITAAEGLFLRDSFKVYPGYLPVDYGLYCAGKFIKR
jgi:ubiquinone/menaquinone biosynthesis C-methylase UbiE